MRSAKNSDGFGWCVRKQILTTLLTASDQKSHPNKSSDEFGKNAPFLSKFFLQHFFLSETDDGFFSYNGGVVLVLLNFPK